MIKIWWVALICFVLTSSCGDHQSSSVVRPIEPWALRSVLDYHPRMLTLALDSAMYVAYDLENCGLYKAWRGGVNWEGIVYDDTKSVQPTTWGENYVEDPISQHRWYIEDGADRTLLTAHFKGYQFDKNQIYLSYQLTSTNDTILIQERPEYFQSNGGAPGLERIFHRTDNGQPVFLETQSQIVTINPGETVFQTAFEPIPPQYQEEDADLRKVQGYNNVTARYWVEKSDCLTCHEYSGNTVGPGFMEIALKYAETDEVLEYLASRIREGGSGVWGTAQMNPHPQFTDDELKQMARFILAMNPDPSGAKTAAPSQPIDEIKPNPGFGASLESVHPSYDLTNLEPPGYEFKVGGLAFFPDGRMLVTTWTPAGSVYILDNYQSGDINQIKVKLFAQGLVEPLGAAIVDNAVYVLQKHELTQLIDHDGDGVADEYQAICNGFGVSSDFHEFAFGLVHQDNHFYANLSVPMRLMDNERPLPDRGRTVKIAMNGSIEHINSGLRQPNGIGIGVDNEIFITDNQGQWLPGNKLIHVKKGSFHGLRWGLPDSLMEMREDSPAVWLPDNEIGNSPTEPTMVQTGPYQGQMLHGDVTHGGIKRVFLEKINGAYQGVVFRFSQGLKAGVNRLRWGPDGALYIGEVGMVGGWSYKGERSGLQRLKYNGKIAFEMLAIRSLPDGFQIEYTEPLGKESGNKASDYLVQQWWYLPTAAYGGPKMDLQTLSVKLVEVSDDRKKVRLMIPGLKPGRVVYFLLNEQMKSSENRNLWSGEAWYTLNNLAKTE